MYFFEYFVALNVLVSFVERQSHTIVHIFISFGHIEQMCYRPSVHEQRSENLHGELFGHSH